MNTNTIVDDASERICNGALRASGDVIETKQHAKRTTSSELSNLISDVEDLLQRVIPVGDIDVEKLRERLEVKIQTAKQVLSTNSKQMTQSAREAAKATDDYVRKSPWQAVGIAALAGAAIGYAFSRR